MTQKKYKLGIIGCGGFGSFCIDAYKKMPEVEIVAVCRTKKSELEKCARRFGIPYAYTDYKKLIKNPEVEIVYIATPPFLHTKMAIYAAKHKKNLVLEKPLALNLRDADRIIKTIRKSKVKAVINFVMYYNPIYLRVKEITENKLFGEIKEVTFENYAKILPSDHWFWDRRKSGGILVEHGVHFFDIFGHIIGSKPIEYRTLEGNKKVLASLKYKNGVLASFFHSFDKPVMIEKTQARISYERGYAEIFGWLPLELRLEGITFDKVKKEVIKVPYFKEELYQKILQEITRDLIKSIENSEYKPKVSLEEARESLKIALLATKAV